MDLLKDGKCIENQIEIIWVEKKLVNIWLREEKIKTSGETTGLYLLIISYY